MILLKNVSGLGKASDIKEVADGYAKNYLMPNKLAAVATPKAVNLTKQLQIKKIKDAEKDLISTEKLANKLNTTVLEISGEINNYGRLYASITKSSIFEGLKEKGIIVNKEKIILPEPIKELGDYKVKINLDHGLETEICISVVEK